jgi:hypothetical protein
MLFEEISANRTYEYSGQTVGLSTADKMDVNGYLDRAMGAEINKQSM